VANNGFAIARPKQSHFKLILLGRTEKVIRYVKHINGSLAIPN